MNKKKALIIILSLVAVLAAALIAYLFISSRLKIDGDGSENSIPYVYDENGETETDPDTGLPYVYETDESGKAVVNEDGEPATKIYGSETLSANESTNPTVTINDMGESESAKNDDASDATKSGEDKETDPETDANGDVIGIVTLPN